jgi:type II secretory pathway component PulK
VIVRARHRRGFVLIIVLVVVTMLGILAGSFALSMRVETRLAGNSSLDSEMEWLGRSGVEYAKFILANTGSGNQTVNSLRQIWAGGPGDPGETNGPLAGISLKNVECAPGIFSITITDLDRRFNVNTLARSPEMIRRELLDRALSLIGVEGSEISTIADSIGDWVDRDDLAGLSGAESDYYLALDPAYLAKNGPIDDLAELLLVQGVTPAIYWGPRAQSHLDQLFQPRRSRGDRDDRPAYRAGLVDLFTAFGSGRVNVNTASPDVIRFVLGVDDAIADNFRKARAGFDGMEGTEDDTPFPSPGAVAGMVPGLNPAAAGILGNMLGVQSSVFEVVVEARIGNYQRQFVALLGRPGGREVQTLQFSWR